MVQNMISRCLTLAAVVLVCGGSQPALGQSKVRAGVSAAVKGEIQIASLGTIGRVARSGEDIFLGDRISSGKNAGMQVLLLDETVFTIGAQSALTIDEFVFNPETGSGKVAAQVVKGAFRFVTGRIAKRQPLAMVVRLPVGSIGIRGTIAAGRVDGNSSLVVLLGPGSNTDTDERVGRILVSNAGETVEISRAGFATTIEGLNAAPVEPFLLPAADLRALTRSLDQGAAPKQEGGNTAGSTGRASKQGTNGNQNKAGDTGNTTSRQQNDPANNDTGGGQKSATSTATTSGSQLNTANTHALAGEGQVAANENASTSLNTGDASKDGDRLVDDATQGDPVNQLPSVSAGVATFDELRRIQTGTHSFVVDTAFTQTKIDGVASNLPGNMRFQLDFDFGARTFGGGGSELRLDTTAEGGNIDLTSPIPVRDYQTDTGLAAKTLGSDQADPPEVKGSKIEIRNSNGIIAQTLNANIVYDDGNGNRGAGSGDSPARVSN
jgi:hypothetical protein